MLNVDNTKWEQELGVFAVEGIPHALARGEKSVPHARVVVGQYSNAEARKVHHVSDPRSHG
ncbi:putative thioredoxin [Lupinus albus]|uniref:Putative thioredoxin n=1 Tax=Lupinus albus TaxID=3870 RepID=A0A6A4QLG9_LUPAL|nr:putative thioredoxin [Lupinus albus]